MGLDMYAYATRQKPTQPIDFEVDASEDIAYWRKHPNLHGWMQALYVEKGGDPDPHNFNCVNLELTAEDLDRLEADIKADKLPSTSGFFFGQSDGSEHSEDLQFIAKAREHIAAGQTVYYSSWW